MPEKGLPKGEVDARNLRALAQRVISRTKVLPAVNASADEVLAALTAVDSALSAFKEARKIMLERVQDWIEDHPDEQLQTPDKRWYIGYKTNLNRTCTKEELFEAIMWATGGDLDAVAKTISGSKSAFLISELRELLGDDFDKYFATERVANLTTGKAQKELKSLPTKMGKGRKSG